MLSAFARPAHAQLVNGNGPRTAPPAGARAPLGPIPPPYPVDEEYLEWPLAPADKAYGSIDGHEMYKYVQDLCAIPEKYRDEGHQFWGRITGTSADQETQDWLVQKFKAAGISDIRIQNIDLPPQWMPQSWSVSITGNGTTLNPKTVTPTMSTPGTPPGGLDLEAVYVGLASEADFIGRDVKGKAVFIYSSTHSHQQNTGTAERTALRAQQKGAAAVFIIMSLPGNVSWSIYNQGTNIPTFMMGLEDGLALRDMIGKIGANGPAPHVKINMDVQMVPNEKTSTIWATLPGRTDEKIYLVAHRDGFFDGAVDNGTGIASSVALAEYFAKTPKEKRRRTIVFVSTTGHHSNGDNAQPHVTVSGDWIYKHHDEVFANTALLINLEHTATTDVTYYLPGSGVRKATSTEEPLFWFFRGSTKLEDLMFNDFREFGVPLYTEADRAAYGEIQDYTTFSPTIQTIDFGAFSHSDHEGIDMVPWTGLEATTRAYAKIMDDVNKLDTKDLQPTPPAAKQP